MNIGWMLLVLIVGVCAMGPGRAGQVAASWEGLTGLFTQPTAETLPPGEIAVTFSEIRFTQGNGESALANTWFTSSATIALDSRWEFAVARRQEDLDIDPVTGPGAGVDINDHNWMGHVKCILFPVREDRVGVALGIMDITDASGRLESFVFERGRRYYLVGSYRWAHLGVTYDDQNVGLYGGFKLRISDTTDLIGEYVTRPLFIQTDPEPANNVNFNLGLRFYPPEIPGVRADLVAVGDNDFDFGFSFSYHLNP